MNRYIVTIATSSLLALGCGASYPPPTQQASDVQSANRSAIELGAQKNPKAQLHLKLAEEQLKLAEAAMKDDENEAAEDLLRRAKADAELAIALTREEDAKIQAEKTVDRASQLGETISEQQGASR